MRIDFRPDGGVMIVEPQEDRLDATAVVSFKGQVLDAINQGNLRLVLSLGKVQFIDSSGLTAIVSTLKSLGKEGEMVVCGLCPTTGSLFKLTRLDRIIKLFSDEATAVKALST